MPRRIKTLRDGEALTQAYPPQPPADDPRFALPVPPYVPPRTTDAPPAYEPRRDPTYLNHRAMHSMVRDLDPAFELSTDGAERLLERVDEFMRRTVEHAKLARMARGEEGLVTADDVRQSMALLYGIEISVD